jgi:hypothetical protein
MKGFFPQVDLEQAGAEALSLNPMAQALAEAQKVFGQAQKPLVFFRRTSHESLDYQDSCQ